MSSYKAQLLRKVVNRMIKQLRMVDVYTTALKLLPAVNPLRTSRSVTRRGRVQGMLRWVHRVISDEGVAYGLTELLSLYRDCRSVVILGYLGLV